MFILTTVHVAQPMSRLCLRLAFGVLCLYCVFSFYLDSQAFLWHLSECCSISVAWAFDFISLHSLREGAVLLRVARDLVLCEAGAWWRAQAWRLGVPSRVGQEATIQRAADSPCAFQVELPQGGVSMGCKAAWGKSVGTLPATEDDRLRAERSRRPDAA
ncbi:hypothetical protein NDU88_007367 [Pleurodeles waltl]|uniref:Secreted protein n=1 Tax=Pleurodeles waltl TaxID=8319 RepID=A0AAV7NSW4_PLEWA|nr:hypothetical protein NDU88_007367 [Pleurodeles waltl]